MGRIHAANLAARCPSAQLAWVFDADPDVARQVGEQLEVPWTASFDDILADGRVDAVAIAAPTRAHAELSVRASQAGQHVFCEKPISLDRQATVQTIEKVLATGVTFQVGFHRRFDPDWVAAVDRMRAGELGHVYLFRTSLRDMTPPDPKFLAGSGGFFTDVTIHDLDTARWMVGEVMADAGLGVARARPRLRAALPLGLCRRARMLRPQRQGRHAAPRHRLRRPGRVRPSPGRRPVLAPRAAGQGRTRPHRRPRHLPGGRCALLLLMTGRPSSGRRWPHLALTCRLAAPWCRARPARSSMAWPAELARQSARSTSSRSGCSGTIPPPR
jgi:hypothetical protein